MQFCTWIRIRLFKGGKDYLVWFQKILDHGCLEELPLSKFGNLPVPYVELYMDASNLGLAVLDPACDSFLQIKFDTEEISLFLGPVPMVTTSLSMSGSISVWWLLCDNGAQSGIGRLRVKLLMYDAGVIMR
ncbi:LOW QUALITY PROTEIN: hypothetical protein PHMEG_00013166 [Phytophthora megakarya]|uniref:Uncharacterized protein n=1 Tax=Phytophthora megakarya TaxID=4795 RepID=A0A225W6Z0_9STRA|nr:LOW QUALITY PROTEIN: hypothetical protein PHMEG_00013166 [Phytophthora megakarya]